jgi:CheY-like chemotaxis protein
MMSNILIADANGRRRVQMEVLLQMGGHHTYSVGTIAEAMRYAEIYVPDVLISPDSLPDGDIGKVVIAFRSSGREMLRELPIVTGIKNGTSDENVTRARNNSSKELVLETESVLSNSGAPA